MTEKTSPESHYWPFREGFSEPSPSPYTLASVFSDPLRREIRLSTPFWPTRPPAPWRIQRRDGSWWIEQRHTAHWEAHMCCATGAEAIATFDEESRR
ncbi:hypothetical protein ACFWE3_10965 [Mycobacteriaceae bacterium NPDC060252]